MHYHFHSSERVDEIPVIIAAEDGIEVTSLNEQTQHYMCRGHLEFPITPETESGTALSIKKIIELRYIKIAEMY